MRFFFLSVNFDGSNVLDPLRAYVDTNFNDTFRLGYTMQRNIQLKRSIGILHDSYYSSSATGTLKFFQAEQPKTNL